MSESPMKVVLVTDGSEDSRLAARLVATLFGEGGVELHLVYVVVLSPWIPPGTLSDVEYEQLKRDHKQLFDEEVTRVEAAGASVAQAHFRVGKRVDEEVIRLSEDLGAGLVVVGSKGRNTLRRALMDSDAENIVRYSRCPVLVARGG